MLEFFPAVLKALGRKLAFSLERLFGPVSLGSGPPGRTRRLLLGLAGLALAGGLLLAGYVLILIPLTPSLDQIRKAGTERPSLLLAADGKELARFKRLNREWIPIGQVPRHVIDALVATEDQRFYDHHGIDFRRTAIAAVFTLFGHRQGGSTLSQQLARNLFRDDIGRAPTITRKLKEAITAVKLEEAWSKAQILEIYLNTVPFLFNADGLEMAARTYFNTSAARLSVTEGATLVGMLKGTAYYNPVLNPDRALERRNLVLSQMAKRGALDPERFEALRRRPLGLNFEIQRPPAGPAPHFSEQVRRWLAGWAAEHGHDIYADGLVVHSTIDSRLQRLANQAVERQLEALQAVAEVEWGQSSGRLLSTRMSAYASARRHTPPFRHFWRANPQLMDSFVRESPEFTRLRNGGSSDGEALSHLLRDGEFMATLSARKTRIEAGFVAIDPRDGAVRAWVGSREFGMDRYDHVAQSRRQPGSTFKPFVYAAALEDGMRADREFIDQLVSIRLPDGSRWTPGDGSPPTGEAMTLEDGLVYSKNTITAQVMDAVGPRKVAQLAREAGLRDSPLEAVPSLALGTSPVTLLEMVSAYGTIAGLGQYAAPVLVTRVTDRHGKVLAEFQPRRENALRPDTAIRLIDMLRGAVDRGTGRGLRQTFGIEADVAGKTGTTQNNTDGWFILMHPQLVAGAWVGFNDPRVRMRSDYWGQGAHNALYVVGDFFRQALSTRALSPAAQFPVPERPHTLGNAIDRAGSWLRGIFGLGKDGRRYRSGRIHLDQGGERTEPDFDHDIKPAPAGLAP